MTEDRSRDLNVVGHPRRRVDGRAKVLGQTRFADDIELPRMLHCKLLRSPLPHARIKRLDTSRALAHPDVHLVLTGADLPIEFGILPVSQDEEAICGERVRYVGDPVAALVARDELTAPLTTISVKAFIVTYFAKNRSSTAPSRKIPLPSKAVSSIVTVTSSPRPNEVGPDLPTRRTMGRLVTE